MSADHTKVTTERTDQEKYFNKLERTLNLYALAMPISLPVLGPFIHFQLAQMKYIVKLTRIVLKSLLVTE